MRMRKVLVLLLCACFLAGSFGTSTQAQASSAQSMIVLEAGSNRILRQQNAHAALPIASTTKIVTAITVIENVQDLDKVVAVPKAAAGVEGSSIYLGVGEKITYRNLLYGLMLQSGNDCAATLAITVGGDIAKFAQLMNKTAKNAGAKNSNFVNPHGLHNDKHYSSAYDLAVISSYAMKNPVFRQIVGTKATKMPWEGREYERSVMNKNKILWQVEGGNGIKTGYTKRAGRCLVASAKRGEMEVIAIVLNCGPMFQECAALINSAFNTYEPVEIIARGCELARASVLDSKNQSVRLCSKNARYYPLAESEKGSITYEFEISKAQAPVFKFKELGQVSAFNDGRLIASEKLYSMDNALSPKLKQNLHSLNQELDENN